VKGKGPRASLPIHGCAFLQMIRDVSADGGLEYQEDM
jgi:hypothetical protein